MNNRLSSLKDSLLNIFYPKFCFGCSREGNYLCDDCLGTLGISEYRYCLCEEPLRIPEGGKCARCQPRKFNGLYFSLPYKNPLVRKLIHQLKYEPFVKDLSKELARLIITSFSLMEKNNSFSDYILTFVPLHEKRQRERGFNQAEEIAKELSRILEIPLIDSLTRTRETLSQVDLSEVERKYNIKDAFLAKDKNKIKGQKILLVDDVYTTGSTMEECAFILKSAGAKEVWGVVVARG